MTHKAYIDSLRGFAIFIVVIGHCCEFGLGRNDTLFNSIYFSFHMPLFMFISGLVAFHRPDYKFIPFVKSKACRLLIPFFVVGGLSCFARDVSFLSFIFDFSKWGYWFLPALFTILLLMFPSYKMSTRYNKDKVLWKDVSFYIVPLVVMVAGYRFLPISINNLLTTKYIVKLYPFVLMGMLTAKYTSIETLLNRDIVKCLLIVLSVVSFVVIYHLNGAISIVGYFIVPIIYLLFKSSYSLSTCRALSIIGGGVCRYTYCITL